MLEEEKQYYIRIIYFENIAGRLPENSRNSLVDLQSQKNSKKDRPKNSSFHWRLICYNLTKNLYKFLLPLLAVLKYPSIRVTHTHLTLSLWIKVNKSQLQKEEVIFESEVSQVWPKKNRRNEQKNSLH